MPYAPTPPKSAGRYAAEPPPPSRAICERYVAELACVGMVETSVFHGLSDGNTEHEPSGPFCTPVRRGGPGVTGTHAAAITASSTITSTPAWPRRRRRSD